VIRQTVDDLVERLFGGETMPLVRHLIEERGIERQDLDELRELIDRLEHEGTNNERPKSERPKSERPSNERPSNERPKSERPKSERPSNERPRP
jgi:hypothetical protein